MTITPASVTLNAVGDQQQYQAQVTGPAGTRDVRRDRYLVEHAAGSGGGGPCDGAGHRHRAWDGGYSGGGPDVSAARPTLEVVQVPVALEKTQGDGEVGFFGEALAVSPAVRVLDANGHPAPGKGVVFEVTSGGGSVFPEVANTGPDGAARTEWTMGEDSVQTLSCNGLWADRRIHGHRDRTAAGDPHRFPCLGTGNAGLPERTVGKGGLPHGVRVESRR